MLQLTKVHSKQATEKKIIRDAFVKGDKYFMTGDLLAYDKKGFIRFVDRWFFGSFNLPGGKKAPTHNLTTCKASVTRSAAAVKTAAPLRWLKFVLFSQASPKPTSSVSLCLTMRMVACPWPPLRLLAET